MKLPPNILSHWGDPFYKTLETTYLERVFEHLQNYLGKTFNALTFVVYKHQMGKPIPTFTSTGLNTVLILLADESRDVDCSRLPVFNTIFKSYANMGELNRSVAPFPVAYSNEVGQSEYIPFERRRYDITFSGYLSWRRLDFFRQFTLFHSLPERNLKNPTLIRAYKVLLKLLYSKRDFSERWPNSYIKFTNGFAQGLSGGDYANLIANSRVVLCPPGFASNECIRHWEAMRHGCIMVTAPLPGHYFYKGYPMYFVEQWSRLFDTINKAISDRASMRRQHLEAMEHWKNSSGEISVARHMADVILSNINSASRR